MKNYVFYNPVKILFGKGQIKSISNEIDEDAKVLIVYGGGSIKTNGIYEQVTDALVDFDYYEFSGIEPNPSYETCMKAVEMISEYEIDFILAVGGGSVADASKFIAAAACFEGDDSWDILAHNTPVEEALPLGVILTLPATGTEMNANAVITRNEFKEKLAFNSLEVMPMFSVLDPTVVESLPKRQIANGIVDAYVHVIEQYLTYPLNAQIQDRFAESILLTLIEEGPKVFSNPESYMAAANFMWSTTMALNGLISCGVPEDWSTHIIGHEITALHGVDHARTLAIVLPGVMQVMKESKKEKIVQYAARVWDIKDGSTDEIIEQAIAKTIEFFESFDIQTRLRDYQIPMETIDEIVDRMEARGYVNIGEHNSIGVNEIKKILKSRY